MIQKLTYIESSGQDPYENLAVEEYLLLHCEDTECILYLWQNRRTVVIGRNQNAWKECRLTKLKDEGGHLARRLSGGGAVYHDLGNLNFTFLVSKKNYDVARQQGVILRALGSLGINAELSGRNDVLVEGKKVSGNAFYRQEEHCYHHGTLMLSVDVGALSRYLTVSEKKLKAKGVDSVRARVGNLTDARPGLTADMLRAALLAAFEEEYGASAKRLSFAALPKDEIAARKERFASWEWLLGRKMEFQYELEHRFSWGGVNLQFQVENGCVRDARVYSDSLYPEKIGALPGRLFGVRFTPAALGAAVGTDDPIAMDIAGWLKHAEL